MTVELTKAIEPGSLREKGQRAAGVSTLDIPVAGRDLATILGHVGGTAYRIGRIDPRNAFVIDRDPLRLLYVRPGYRGCRSTAARVFASTSRQVDVDHALGGAIAGALGLGYCLMIRVPSTVNRSHGCFEHPRAAQGSVRDGLCFVDQRIFDKWLDRYARARWTVTPGSYTYVLDTCKAFGLTLKQTGTWAKRWV